MTPSRFQPGPWQRTRIERVLAQTPRMRSYVLRPAQPLRFLAGQHVDVRLTAEDGYTAERSYSIASAPDDGDLLELAIERLDDGEVSPWFHDVAEPGDEIELRGPVGWSFAWSPDEHVPVLLLGGGSGVVPLVSMARAHRRHPTIPMALLYSARRRAEAGFIGELLRQADHDPQLHLRFAITREPAPRACDYERRIDAGMLAHLLAAWGHAPSLTFICGSNAFVNAASAAAVAAGVPAAQIRTERFGG
jgi:ferredoxin-NADP reductase